MNNRVVNLLCFLPRCFLIGPADYPSNFRGELPPSDTQALQDIIIEIINDHALDAANYRRLTELERAFSRFLGPRHPHLDYQHWLNTMDRIFYAYQNEWPTNNAITLTTLKAGHRIDPRDVYALETYVNHHNQITGLIVNTIKANQEMFLIELLTQQDMNARYRGAKFDQMIEVALNEEFQAVGVPNEWLHVLTGILLRAAYTSNRDEIINGASSRDIREFLDGPDQFLRQLKAVYQNAKDGKPDYNDTLEIPNTRLVLYADCINNQDFFPDHPSLLRPQWQICLSNYFTILQNINNRVLPGDMCLNILAFTARSYL